ncbi:hypothetical protein OM513_08950 [Sphingomonas canadensis]|nr:hypothetical protein [Sphingomonas canadensis]MCW3836164.1 hypothetical protein [Sphingomonas canadensis]
MRESSPAATSGGGSPPLLPGIYPPLARASATLLRGASFLGAGLRPWPGAEGAAPITGRYRAKVIGNGLRELDRFLNLLIDEAALARGLAARPGQRNTSNKLGAYRQWLGRPHPDAERLRALGRSRECLFHCEGRVTRGDSLDCGFLTAGWPELPGTQAPLRRFGIGERIEASGEDLDDVCALYRRIAQELCG